MAKSGCDIVDECPSVHLSRAWCRKNLEHKLTVQSVSMKSLKLLSPMNCDNAHGGVGPDQLGSSWNHWSLAPGFSFPNTSSFAFPSYVVLVSLSASLVHSPAFW